MLIYRIIWRRKSSSYDEILKLFNCEIYTIGLMWLRIITLTLVAFSHSPRPQGPIFEVSLPPLPFRYLYITFAAVPVHLCNIISIIANKSLHQKVYYLLLNLSISDTLCIVPFGSCWCLSFCLHARSESILYHLDPVHVCYDSGSLLEGIYFLYL